MKTYNNDPKLKAKASEDKIASFLVKKGFTVSQIDKSNSNGVDIVAIKNKRHFLIEVKTPIFTSRSWRIKKSHPKSDYVAWVMPNGQVYFATSNSKDLFITSLIKLYEEL